MKPLFFQALLIEIGNITNRLVDSKDQLISSAHGARAEFFSSSGIGNQSGVFTGFFLVSGVACEVASDFEFES